MIEGQALYERAYTGLRKSLRCRPIPNHYPSGYIPRIEDSLQQVDYIRSQSEITVVMLNLDFAERLLSLGLDSTCFGSNIETITTSTIHDDKLPRFHTIKEAEIVRDFGPTWHVPCDRPIYFTQSPKERSWYLQNQLQATLELNRLLADSGICIIPLLKGVNHDELAHCHSVFKSEGLEYFAYYAAQYFGGSRGNRRRQLITDIRAMVTNLNIDYLMIIGIQAPSILHYMPPEVKAFAGLDCMKKRFWNHIGVAPTFSSPGSTEKSLSPMGYSRLDVLNSKWEHKDLRMFAKWVQK